MHKSISLIFILILFGVYADAQSTITLSPDFVTAAKININRKYTFSKSPLGSGTLNEFPFVPGKSGFQFKEERNTAWFEIDAPVAGQLTFEIRPLEPKDDYDWMLFKDSKSFRDEIKAGNPSPLRSNNARNDPKTLGKTGLKEGYENLFERPGPGKSYSKPINIAKGERYYLIIDNIYEGGSGFELQLFLKLDKKNSAVMEGIVKDKTTGFPLNAKIILEEDSTGTFLTEVKTGADGRYTISAPKGATIYTTASASGYLFKSSEVKVAGDRVSQDFELDKISTGKKLTLFNIYFSPNKDIVLPAGDSELERLIKTLKEFPEYNIRIIGHTNNNVFANPKYLQQLSFNRAVSVKNILVKNGISEKRISCAGMGGKSPITNSKDPVEGLKNLRVEVVLTKQ